MNIKSKNLYFLPLGGSGEIGMNCNLYHYDDEWIMIDLGVMFSNSDSEPYEIIMPDLDFIFKKKRKIICNHINTCTRGPYRCSALFIS